jgi:hypothetical protein
MSSLCLLLALGLAQDSPGTSVWDRLSFDAEGRMRGEATFDNVDSTTGDEIDDRYRGRFRFRLGGHYEMMESLSAHARLSTASDGAGELSTDANNPHWDFGDDDGFSGANVVLDRFFLDWEAMEKELHVWVGKQPHALAVPPIYGDFLWDSDISPAGVSTTWKPESDGDFSFDVRAAAYVATEIAANEDPNLLAAQGNAYLRTDDVKLQNSLAIYGWSATSVGTAVAGNQGNSATSEDFLVIEDFFAATVQGGPLDEMTGYVQLLHNLDESESGIAVGAQVGSSTWKRDNMNAFLVCYALDGDSVFSPVAQDDTPIAGTGLNDGDGDGQAGVLFGGEYYLRDNVRLKLWALTSNPEGAEDDPVRVRLDLDFKVL